MISDIGVAISAASDESHEKSLTMKKQMRTAYHHRRGGVIAGSLAVAVLLTGCAGMAKSPDEIVVERAQARWDAVIRGDYEAGYQYYSPGYRSSTSLVDFALALRMRRVKWTSAEYLDHRCEEKRCTLTFNIGFKVATPVPGLKSYDGVQTIKDTWILADGEWWYLPPQD